MMEVGVAPGSCLVEERSPGKSTGYCMMQGTEAVVVGHGRMQVDSLRGRDM